MKRALLRFGAIKTGGQKSFQLPFKGNKAPKILWLKSIGIEERIMVKIDKISKSSLTTLNLGSKGAICFLSAILLCNGRGHAMTYMVEYSINLH